MLNTLLTKLASQGPTSHSVNEDEDRIKWATGAFYGGNVRLPIEPKKLQTDTISVFSCI